MNIIDNIKYVLESNAAYGYSRAGLAGTGLGALAYAGARERMRQNMTQPDRNQIVEQMHKYINSLGSTMPKDVVNKLNNIKLPDNPSDKELSEYRDKIASGMSDAVNHNVIENTKLLNAIDLMPSHLSAWLLGGASIGILIRKMINSTSNNHLQSQYQQPEQQQLNQPYKFQIS